MIEWVIEDNGSFYRDGETVYSGSWTHDGVIMGGSPFSVSLDGTVSQPEMDLAEMIVVNRSDCDESTRQTIDGYLAWKWGMTANLPSDHPYKNRRP